MRIPLLIVSLLVTSACSGPAAEQPPPQEEAVATITAQGEKDLRTEAAVSDTLRQAETAFMEGRWGDVVVNAGRVRRGLASPEEYYTATRLMGFASCKRKDARPLPSLWLQLKPADRDRLRAECQQAGINLDDQGKQVVEEVEEEM